MQEIALGSIARNWDAAIGGGLHSLRWGNFNF